MMQSFIFPPKIVHGMDEADHHNYQEFTLSALHTSIKAVIKLMYELNKRIDAEGLCLVYVWPYST